MSKGDIAKAGVIEKIAAAFGSDYIGENSKKYYVWSMEDGQKVQVAISLTCPKTPIGEGTKLDFTADLGDSVVIQGPINNIEIGEGERENLRKMMEKLGL